MWGNDRYVFGTIKNMYSSISNLESWDEIFVNATNIMHDHEHDNIFVDAIDITCKLKK